ncbi:FMN-binding split barrel-related protein [Penicillium longicatenatum]|uniref:FMN-binding split barrel-related protein n=1 Tax=Penicillium longicatenatum TaxID=1561947 RepID=UPI002548EC42|nr:FMN-binding split barrel-related protein [Penicillium longicatenatum]KAJ5636320.1 FMN-binding split barrel-related protein [Penicillium longicatenatum]
MPHSVNVTSLSSLLRISYHLSATRCFVGLGKHQTIRRTLLFSTISKMAHSTNSRKIKAPWRDLLASHLKRTPGYEFTLGTVEHGPDGEPMPRVRTCGCRGFFPELELHPSGQEDMKQQAPGGGNPDKYESDMLTFTTDVRMEKLDQIVGSDHHVEAVFWLPDLMNQWRVKGRAYAFGNPDVENPESSEDTKSMQRITDCLRFKENYDESMEWTWDNVVTEYFANHSPAMRGSFRVPVPGTPRSEVPSNPALKLGQKVKDLYDPVARANFRVVAIIPDKVERLDLSDMNNVRREQWRFEEYDKSRESEPWEYCELWP